MPGLTNNTTLLAAANQIIVALNEISSQIVLGDLSDRLAPDGQSIYAALGTVGDQIEAQTTAIDTDFSNLVTSTDTISTKLTTTNEGLSDINSSISTCCVNLKTKLGEIVTAISNIRFPSGGGGSVGLPGDIGGPVLDEPPADVAEEPMDDYACTAANYVWWYMNDVLLNLSALNNTRAGLTESVVLVLLTASLAAIFSVVGAPAGIISSVLMALVGVVVTIQNWYIFLYFEDLSNEFEAGKDQLVCDLFNAAKANNPTGAKAAIDAFIDAAVDGVVTIEHPEVDIPAPYFGLFDASLRTICKALAGYYLLNKMFDFDADVEAWTPTGAVDCTTCGQTPVEGAVLQTSTSYPYNVLVIGDSTPTGGEPSTGWNIPYNDRKYFYFTPDVEILTFKVTAEIRSSAATDWTVGTMEFSSNAHTVYGTAGVWTEIEYTGSFSPGVPADVQTAISMMGMGGNDFYIRNLLIIANPTT